MDYPCFFGHECEARGESSIPYAEGHLDELVTNMKQFVNMIRHASDYERSSLIASLSQEISNDYTFFIARFCRY